MKKIRVINFVPGLDSGGIAMLMNEWYRRKDSIIEFDIATIGKGMIYDKLLNDKCNLLDFYPITQIGIIKYIKVAYKIIKEGKYDIVHAHVGMMSVFVFLAAKLAGVKCRILHAHGTKYNQDNGKFFNSIIVSILKKASVFLATDYVACSKSAANYLFGNRIAEEKAVIVSNGIDLNKFTFKSIENRRYKVIGYVARFDEVKNHKFLIDVFYELKKSRDDVKLLFVGGGDYKDILKYAKKKKVENYLTILPPQLNINEIYNKMNVFAFPSKNEGFGIVAIEAQACGIPTIISEGVPKDTMVSSLVVQRKLDVELWKKTIEKMLDYEQKKDVHKEIKVHGYDIADSSMKMMDVYKKGISR